MWSFQIQIFLMCAVCTSIKDFFNTQYHIKEVCYWRVKTKNQNLNIKRYHYKTIFIQDRDLKFSLHECQKQRDQADKACSGMAIFSSACMSARDRAMKCLKKRHRENREKELFSYWEMKAWCITMNRKSKQTFL